MRYVYPNNLMAHRSQKRELLKGGVLLGAMVLLVGMLFALAIMQDNSDLANQYIACKETAKGSMYCRLS